MRINTRSGHSCSKYRLHEMTLSNNRFMSIWIRVYWCHDYQCSIDTSYQRRIPTTMKDIEKFLNATYIGVHGLIRALFLLCDSAEADVDQYFIVLSLSVVHFLRTIMLLWSPWIYLYWSRPESIQIWMYHISSPPFIDESAIGWLRNYQNFVLLYLFIIWCNYYNECFRFRDCKSTM